MKTIRAKILLNMIGGMFLLAVIITCVAAFFGVRSTVDSTQKTLSETAKVAAGNIAANLKVYQSIAYEAGCLTRMADPANSPAVKKEIIDQKVETNQFMRGNYVDLNGISPLDGLDVSEREYFQQAKNGTPWISEPAISKSTGDMVVMVAAPIWKDGNPKTGEVVGVVYFTKNVDYLINLVSDIKIGETGTTYILDKKGVTIAHPTKSVVESMENTQDLVKTDKQLTKLASLEAEMIQGRTGFGEYSYGGVDKYLAYAPIDVPSKWSLAISVGKNEFLASIYQSILIMGGISLALLVLFTLVNIRTATTIAKPITRITKRIELIAQGDLHTPVEIEKTKDETETLSVCMKETVDGLNAYIGAIGHAMSEVAKGNLAFERTKIVFVGDFAQLQASIIGIVNRLIEIISEMQRNAAQVSLGSEQVSNGAQALSQGATEQASSIEELMAMMQQISGQIRQTAENAQTAMNEAGNAGKQVESSNEKMQRMIAAMNDISVKSAEIGKIIKTIDDIAFQTNILALNAAVEAARAGAAGKGFAVVADEVRNLAGKSAEAAKNTTALIEQTVAAVANGTRIVDETAAALHGVVDGAKMVTVLVNEISEASATQSSAITQVSTGIEQISAVVQTNSATAEESAAASEELSAQAQSLSSLVATFRLPD